MAFPLRFVFFGKKIAERIKEGLARAKSDGQPKGSLGKSKLDGKQKEIQYYQNKGVNKANLDQIYDVS